MLYNPPVPSRTAHHGGSMHQDAGAFSFQQSLEHEWLITNGLGGYAASTAAGCNTRKYHGLLVAALAPPMQRMVLLSRVEETLYHRGWPHQLAASEYPGKVHPEGHHLLAAFSTDPFPRWAYQGDGWTLIKQLHLLHGQNTACLRYILIGSAADITLELRPLLALRSIHELTYQWNGRPPVEPRDDGQLRITPTRQSPECFLAHDGAYIPEDFWYFNTIYRKEKQRGYRGLEDLWMPAAFKWTLRPGQFVNFVISTDPIDLPQVIRAVEVDDIPAVSIDGLSADNDDPITLLTRSASQFTLDLPEDNPLPVILTTYHWGSPNVRETLIAFTGLYLSTGKFDQAKRLLTTFASHVRDGLLPSNFADDRTPLYNAADTALLFAQAVCDYLRYTSDEPTVIDQFLPVLQQTLRHYAAGAQLGIHLASDGLLVVADASATWMNARAMGKLATPRLPCMVEINALWHNALRIAADLCATAGLQDDAIDYNHQADLCKASFNQRFWNPAQSACFDSIGADDADTSDDALRPNQIFALSLAHPILDEEHRAPMLATLREQLLTPFGLRTLSPHHGAYVSHKGGDPTARDRARHNGPAYPWLLGHYTRALLRVEEDTPATRDKVASLLQPAINHLKAFGQLPELFDGHPPHAPGGAIASAASVGQILQACAESLGKKLVAAVAEPAPASTRPATEDLIFRRGR